MCYCSPPYFSIEAWKKLLYSRHPEKKVIHRTLGSKIIIDASNFTTVMQPLLVDGEMAYAITSYPDNEIHWVHDDDDYPVPEEESRDDYYQPEVLPLGFRKALALETSIHLENVKKYGLEDVDSSSSEYFPDDPSFLYRDIKRQELKAQGMNPSDVEILLDELWEGDTDDSSRFYRKEIWIARLRIILIVALLYLGIFLIWRQSLD